MSDFVTVISPHDDAVLTKKATMVDGKIKVFPAANHKFFKSEERRVNNIKELSSLLTEIQSVPSQAVIRGKIIGGVDKNYHKRRKLRDGGGKKNDQSYEEADHSWVMIDIDGMSSEQLMVHDPVNHPLDTILCIVDLLPHPFRQANFHYQYSSSQGLKPKNAISCHIWFWMDRRVKDRDLKRYFSLYNESFVNSGEIDLRVVDTVLFESVQLHFTANPVIDNFDDPISTRSGYYGERNPEVIISNEWIFNDPKAKGNYIKFLDRVGDDHDGFHHPIMQAAASFVSEFGKPTAQRRQLFIEAVQETIDEAKIKEGRSDGSIAEYRSEFWINKQMDSAITNGFAQGLPDGELAEIIGELTYVSAGDNFYFPETRDYMSKDSVNAWYAHRTGGKAIVPMLVTSEDLRKVHNIQTIPGNVNEIVTSGKRKIFNVWAGRPILEDISEDGDPIPIIEGHIRSLVDGDPEAYDHLTRYIAWCVRKPGHKIKHAVVLGGIQGIGKSFIKVMMEVLMGQENVHPVSNSEIKEKFNGWIESTELVFVEELMAQGKLEIANRLKPLITEDKITIRRMRTDPYNIDNYANIIAFTNHENAMVLDDDDRRYWVWMSKTSKEEKPPPEYFDKLFETLKIYPKSISKWLDTIDISNFNPHAKPPQTSAKDIMTAYSKPMIEHFIESRIDEEDWPFSCDLIVMNHILDVLPHNLGKVGPTKLSLELKKRGAILLGQFRLPDGTKPKIWAIRNQEKWIGVAGPEVKDKYMRPTKDGYNTMGVDY